MNAAFISLAIAFCQTRRLACRLRTKDDVIAWQRQKLRAFMSSSVKKVDYYKGLKSAHLDDLPVIDKKVMLDNFGRLNRPSVTCEEIWKALHHNEERVRGFVVGKSTGTSGNRGLFVISESERFTWLGVMLAKSLPDFPFVRHRVALALPGYGQLYASAAATGRLAVRFFDLALGVDSWAAALREYAPDTLVAPPKVLRALAQAGGLRPLHVFSGAEVLDPLDRTVIEAGFGSRVREIYMATEGLLGVACAEGVLHLAEDVVAFEWEAVAGSAELLCPIITDFTRRIQIMARYRMNDLLRLSDTPCRCGSPLQAVAAVEGRQDDVFRLRSRTGASLVMVTPDVVRNAVVDADRRIHDFRVVQTGPDTVDLVLAAELASEVGSAAKASLIRAIEKAGARGIQVTLKAGLDPPIDQKLRRVRRAWG